MENKNIEYVREYVQSKIYRKYINKSRPIDWEEIRTFGEKGSAINEWFEMIKVDQSWPDNMTLDDFHKICHEMEEIENYSQFCYEATGTSIINDDRNDNNTDTKVGSQDAWNAYKQKLLNEKKFSPLSVKFIEKDAEKIRKRLSLDFDTNIGAIRGVVVGAVQSGKTANMGALIAQCADNGWNCFVILSGMIESLRVQTETRLYNDLKENNRFQWYLLNKICDSGIENTQELSSLNLDNNINKYICVTLKQKERLQNFIKWLKRDRYNAKRLKILLIDDEADQASINTGKIDKGEKKTIYDKISQIVNGIDSEDQRIQLCGAMNYICYTATPYANFLNDSDAKSLYPKNFIATLTPSKSYFGPQQIFGIEEDEIPGLSIVRLVSDDEKQLAQEIFSDNICEMPSSLENAILWFMCCVGAMRANDIKKPFSMLVNVSQKVDNHDKIANLIEDWFSKLSPKEAVKRCRKIWDKEVKLFNLEIFKKEFSDYENIDSIDDYPSFDQIENYIYSLLECGTKHILFNENDQYEYTQGIHLCIDNSKNNKLTDKNEFKRLIYPSKNQLENMVAPAFIVVGGNTLSRGLTLEGLVSTYFLRTGRQADTLMQMGRWFGYRQGYELYPRIWMDENTLEQFEFITKLDRDLRMNLNKYMIDVVSPTEVGPYINNTPAVSWLRITANNKQQSAIVAKYDYTGMQAQTIHFEQDESILYHNIELTRSFLASLGEAKVSRSQVSYVWKNVNVSRIYEFLRNFNFCKSNKLFNDIEPFIEWLNSLDNQKQVKEWNVVLAGIKNSSNVHKWKLNDSIQVNKVYRSKKKNSQTDIINIGVLRSFKDNFEDITREEISIQIDHEIETYIAKRGDKSLNCFDKKRDLNLGVKPMLVLYIIDGKSGRVPTDTNDRETFRLEEDIVGVYLAIPGQKNKKSQLTINISNKRTEEYYNED